MKSRTFFLVAALLAFCVCGPPDSALFSWTHTDATAGEPTLEVPDTPLQSGRGGLYGKITFNNFPIHRARIIASSDLKDLYSKEEPSCYTDPNGYYFLSNLWPGRYHLAVGWPDEQRYWLVRKEGEKLSKGVDVQVEAGEYTLVPWLPLYVIVDLEAPADGAIASVNPEFQWSENRYLKRYEFSLVQRDIKADSLRGKVIFKRRQVEGTGFKPSQPLSPGIYWWTVSASADGKTITATKESGYAGLPIRLPGENLVSSLVFGNDFAVPSPSGDLVTRDAPTLTLAVIVPKRKGERNKKKTLSEFWAKSRGLHTLVTTDSIIKLGGTKQARKIGETLLELHGEKYSVGLAPSLEVSQALMMGLCDCALLWISEHPWEPPAGLKPWHIRLLSLKDEVISEASDKYFYIKPAVIPTGTYVGQTEDVRTIGIYR